MITYASFPQYSVIELGSCALSMGFASYLRKTVQGREAGILKRSYMLKCMINSYRGTKRHLKATDALKEKKI